MEPGAFEEALEARGLAVAEIDVDGRILWCTTAFSRATSASDGPAIEQVRGLWASQHPMAFESVWRHATERGSFHWKAPLVTGGKQLRWRLSMRKDGKTGFLWIETDESQGSVDAAQIERLRELNQMRIHFINTAAHEFATPLTPLRLQTSLLLAEKLGTLTDKQRRAIEMLDRNMERLGQLVRDVLDVSRIEAGRFSVQKDHIDLAEIAHHAVESVMASATGAGVQLSYEGLDSLAIEGDKDRLTQVFLNLLTNALKFTPHGGHVTVHLTAEGSNAVVQVQDSGRGIAPEKMNKLFQPFSQVHDTSQETRSGTGLGLSICQGIVAQHGGRIWAESAGLGLGTKFSFLIPLATEMPMSSSDVGPGPHKLLRVDGREGRWSLFYFKCPECGSRDIEIRLMKNRYDCNHCSYSWK